jgi:hypothetical protein
VLSSIRNAQNSVLSNLLSSARFNRLVEQEALDRGVAYSPDFLADVRKGIWRELDSVQVVIGPYRRNLQRAYLDQVNSKKRTAQRKSTMLMRPFRHKVRDFIDWCQPIARRSLAE